MRGWEVRYGEWEEQVWKNPLEPLTTKYLPYEPHDYLVDQRSFASLTSTATKELAALDPKMKDIFKHMSVGLAPFINMPESERFLLMFQSLEACRALAQRIGVDSDSAKNNAKLIEVLESAKQGIDAKIAERIDGFIERVRTGKPSLKQQLEWVLVEEWKVKTNDLWALSGNKKMPGLIQVRDELAHSGSKALHPQALAVATWHLSILLERVLLTLLKIPLSDTSAAPNRLVREPWYKPAYLLEQRKLVIRLT